MLKKSSSSFLPLCPCGRRSMPRTIRTHGELFAHILSKRFQGYVLLLRGKYEKHGSLSYYFTSTLLPGAVLIWLNFFEQHEAFHLLLTSKCFS